MPIKITSLDRPELSPLTVSDRFRHEVAYFASSRGDGAIPVELGEGEYWLASANIQEIFDDGVVRLVSPLDSDATAELEITEEQERILEWLLEHDVQHIRLDK